MAVGFDSATESGTWTTTDPFTFSAAPSGTATGALLFILQAVAGSDDIDELPTIGGVAMERLISMGMTTAAEEPARVYAFFLAGSWNSSQTISIGHTATANTKIATLIYLTGTDLVCSNSMAAMSESASAEIRDMRLVTASAAMRFVASYTSAAAPSSLTPLSGMTAVSDHDFGSNAARIDRETSTSTDFTIGYSETGVTCAQVAVAIEEGPVDPIPILYVHQWNTQAVNHVFTYPETEADDLLLSMFVASNNGGTLTTPGGWTRADAGTGHTTFLPGVFWLECDGTESGTGNLVTSSGTNSQGQFHIWKIPAAVREIGQDPEFTIVGPTGSGTPDPGSLTPSWGSAATFWFVMLCRDAADAITSLGGNYDTRFVVDLGAGTALASAWRVNEASSEDPPSSSVATTDEEFLAVTVGVRPKGQTTQTHTTDTLLLKTQTKTHTTGAVILKAQTKVHTTDAVVLKAATRTHTTDAGLLKTQAKVHTTDALLTTGETSQEHTTDVLIKKISTKTHTADAALYKTSTKTQTGDALLKKVQTKVHTTDAFLEAVAGVVTKTHTSDAIIVGRGERLDDVFEIQSNVNSDSTSVEVPETTTCALLAVSGLGGSANFFSGGTVTLGGESMILETNADSNGSLSGVAIWTLFFPPTGTQTLAWDWSGSSAPSGGVQLYPAFYAGVLSVRGVTVPGQASSTATSVNASAIGFYQDDIQVAIVGGNGAASTWLGMTEAAGSSYNGNMASFAENFNPSQENLTSTSRLWTNSGTAVAVSGVVLATEPGFVYGKVRASAVAVEGNGSTGFTIVIPTVQVNDVLLVAAASQTGSTVSCTDDDSGGNTWTEIDQGFEQHSWLFMKRATSATSGKTITIAGATHSTTGGVVAFYDVSDDDGQLFDSFDNEGHVSGDEDMGGFTPVDAGEMMCLIVFNYISTGGSGSFGMHDSSPGTMMPPWVNRTSTATADCRVTWGAFPQRRYPLEDTGDFGWSQPNNSSVQSMRFGLRPKSYMVVRQVVHTTDALLKFSSQSHSTDAVLFEPDVFLPSTTFTIVIDPNGQPSLTMPPPIENQGPPGAGALPNQGPTGTAMARAGGYLLKNYRKPTTTITRRD